MSANLVVDIGGSCQSLPSINAGVVGNSGIAYSASGGLIGNSVDMLHSDTFCNLNVAGTPIFTSGQLRIQVQTADSDTSGSYTDPTSGAAQMPTYFSSGGILILNSGGVGSGLLGGGTSGQNMQSGFNVFAGFQRPQRFVRANMVSGDFYGGTLQVNFVAQNKTTGSGGGFSYQPGSGTINV